MAARFLCGTYPAERQRLQVAMVATDRQPPSPQRPATEGRESQGTNTCGGADGSSLPLGMAMGGKGGEGL